MSKLLVEPRVPKVIDGPKKKKRFVKKEKVEGEPKVKYTIIRESDKTKVDELFRVYRESPFKARVKHFNNKGQHSFSRTVIFEFNDTDFEIALFHVKFGISITNKIYGSQSKTASVIHRKGKIWYRCNGKILPLTYGALLQFIESAEGFHRWSNKPITDSKIFKFMHSRFHWLLAVSESKISMGLSLNKIKEKKLFGLNDISRHVMQIPPKIADMVVGSQCFGHIRNNQGNKSIKGWLETLKVLDGPEHLTPELLDSHLFVDACKMAKTLGRKVNCRWGLKRLTEEHDKWSVEITNILLDCELEYDLNIRPIYKAFAEFSGFKLLKTNKDLLREGMMQHHCVGTYIDVVNRGSCAIYHVEGFTLQLTVAAFTPNVLNIELKENEDFSGLLPKKSLIHIEPHHRQILTTQQFRGRYNEPANKELVERVNATIVQFVNADGFENTAKGEATYKPIEESVVAAEPYDIFAGF